MPEVPAAAPTIRTLAQSLPPSSQAAKVALALGAVCVVWGSTYLAIRVAMLAGTLMITFARWRQWRDAAVVGACLLLVGNGGVTLGERYMPSGLAAMLVATVPMFMGRFGWRSGLMAATGSGRLPLHDGRLHGRLPVGPTPRRQPPIL